MREKQILIMCYLSKNVKHYLIHLYKGVSPVPIEKSYVETQQTLAPAQYNSCNVTWR